MGEVPNAGDQPSAGEVQQPDSAPTVEDDTQETEQSPSEPSTESNPPPPQPGAEWYP
jgi:hypothetical protein